MEIARSLIERNWGMLSTELLSKGRQAGSDGNKTALHSLIFLAQKKP